MGNSTDAANHDRIDNQSSSRQQHLSVLFSSSLFLVFVILLFCVPTSSAIPLRCLQPPPPLNCGGGTYYGEAFYYNISSPVPCLRMPNWGCAGENMFPSIDECMATCEPEPTPTPPTLSPEPTPSNMPTHPPEEICNLPIRNFFCGTAQLTNLWVYNIDTKICHELIFFNCLEVQKNMFDTEEECINMCGQFSPHYTHPSSQPGLTSSVALPAPTPSSSSLNHVIGTVAKDTTNIPTVSQPVPTPSFFDHVISTVAMDTTNVLIVSQPVPTPSSSSSHDHVISTVAMDTAEVPTSVPTVSQPAPTHVISTVAVIPTNVPTVSQPPTTSPKPLPSATDSTESDSSDQMAIFDIASIIVGVVVFLLIGILVVVIISLLHRWRTLMKRHPPGLVGSHLAVTNPCKQGNVEVHIINHHSYPASSCHV